MNSTLQSLQNPQELLSDSALARETQKKIEADRVVAALDILHIILPSAMQAAADGNVRMKLAMLKIAPLLSKLHDQKRS